MRGIADPTKRRKIFNFYRDRADIICLQETHSSKETENLWIKEWGGVVLFSHGETKARGVAMLLSNKIFCNCIRIKNDAEGRILSVTMKIDDQLINIITIYAPNADKPKFFQELEQYFDQSCEKTVILGDFNLVLNSDLDRYGSSTNNNKAKEMLEKIMENNYLSDVWRDRHENDRQYSWANAAKTKFSRLDFALVSKGLDTNVQNMLFLNGIQTDHRAFVLTIVTSQGDRGPGFWKFNNQYIKDSIFCEKLQSELQALILTLEQQHNMSDCDKWDKIKDAIKRTTQKFARSKVSKQRLVESSLVEKICYLESMQPLTKRDAEILDNTKADLDEILTEKTAAVIFRSKCRWFELGEKNTKYFYTLEKRRANAKNCYCLLKDNTLITNPTDILEEQRTFYETLYEINNEVHFDLINESEIVVSKKLKEKQNEQITILDLSNAFSEMAVGETPGYDGLTVELYKKFSTILSNPLHRAIIETYQTGRLFKSARMGILNLIPKPNKDSCILKNVRPITLLNVDYKLIEKVLAQKMMPAIHEIISQDQRGFIPGRSISINIRKLLDIIENLTQNQKEGLVLSCDFEKCFDKVAYTALLGSLKYFDFATTLIRWTEIIYSNFQVKVQNNGFLSDPIDINQGLHQEGPASSCYFFILAEILSINLKSKEQIKGIPVEDIINILNQFTDDLDVFSENCEESVKTIVQELQYFYTKSGFKVSYDKTTMYRIGSLQKSNTKIYTQPDVKWSSDTIRVLGIDIYQNEEVLIEKNYAKTLNSASATLNQWANRSLSLIGKVNVVNTLIMSLFIYKLFVLPMIPHKLLKKIEQLVSDFIWNGKRPKIALKILQNSKKEGGLGLTNIRNREIAIKATWPKLLKTESDYAQMVYKLMGNGLNEWVW